MEEESTTKTVKKNKAPNHILADGTFIYLPEPTSHDRAKFFERSIAEHGLVSAVAENSSNRTGTSSNSTAKEGEEIISYKKEDEENDKESVASSSLSKSKQKQKQQEQKIHPLAVASARLQGYGIAELSKAINLGGLVVSSDYLDLANIVSSSSCSQQPQQSDAVVKSATDDKNSSDATTATSATAATSSEDAKGSDLSTGVKDESGNHAFLEEQRLRSSYILKRKRTQFEHASKVLTLHKKRLTRSLSIQKKLDRRYLHLRKKWRLVAPEHGTKVVGPVRATEVVAIDVEIYNRDRTLTTTNFSTSALARMVPRYVTIQLKDQKTIAEPFLIADPTIGKIEDPEYFDPSKVPKLTLLLAVEKSSTGYIQHATALPTCNDSGDMQDEDEKVIFVLQHSLFCASLFDSMKQEVTTKNHTPATTTPAAWISSELDESYLPARNLMTNSHTTDGICVIHVHQGEIKVQLNSEYSITLQLIEASANQNNIHVSDCQNSGSQTPKELEALCRSLLLHAQFIYHDFCMNRTAATDTDVTHLKPASKTSTASPHIVHQCVHLGAKILLEKKARTMLQTLIAWFHTTYPKANSEISVQFLDLTLFDSYSQFVVALDRIFSVDVTMHQSEGITVVMNNCLDEEVACDFHGAGGAIFRNVTFGSVDEFKLYLKFQIQTCMS